MNKSSRICKLLVTVVNSGMARKVVKASKQAGAEGGTTILGKSTGSSEITTLFGIPIEPEKEIIFTLTSEEKLDDILESIVSTAKLDKTSNGISFVLDISTVVGICHLCITEERSVDKHGGSKMVNGQEIIYDLIVTIVNKGQAGKVMEYSKKAGAEGGTIMFGRGTGIHEHAKLFGITIEPEKEVILTLIDRQQSSAVLDAIQEAAQLNKPGKGIAFVLEVEKVVGINHLLNRMVNEQLFENHT